MKPRRSLQDMASSSREPKLVAGRPADVCPYCGGGMYVDGVNRTEKEVTRYIECRNGNCRRRFLSYQPAAKLLREIRPVESLQVEREDDDADQKPTLRLSKAS